MGEQGLNLKDFTVKIINLLGIDDDGDEEDDGNDDDDEIARAMKAKWARCARVGSCCATQ